MLEPNFHSETELPEMHAVCLAHAMAFLFLIVFLVSPTSLAEAQIGLQNILGAAYIGCLRNTTSLSITFSQNLRTALSNFTVLSSGGTRYAINIVGSPGQDRVYAVFQCRGDLSREFCQECVKNATTRLPQKNCPLSIEARMQLDGCFLRYGNNSFFDLDTSFVQGYCYAKTSDPLALTAISNLMQNVTSLAPKRGGFASAILNQEYALAQCLGYLNESECSTCLANTPYRTVCDSTLGEQVHLGSCFYRYEPYLFFQTEGSPSPTSSNQGSPSPTSSNHPRDSISPTPGGSSRESNVPVSAIAVPIGSIITITLLCAIVVRVHKKRKIKGEVLEPEEESLSGILTTKMKPFSLQELRNATNGFNNTMLVGEGAFGSIYKGILANGEQVAIKRLKIGTPQGKEEFLNEVRIIMSVQHRNLIKLFGCCAEYSERILVCEYLKNGSLDSVLFEGNETLSWVQRYQIIMGIAKGLAYLHEESHIQIIHRDIKPNNILLDDQMDPVITDFGLARLVKGSMTFVNTTIVGTRGYVAPEYALKGDLSDRVDVFSFGIVCLEIVSGQRNMNSDLLWQAWESYEKKRLVDFVDEKLGNDVSLEQVGRVLHIALLCTQENPRKRPAMSTITTWLYGMSVILDIPSRPSFVYDSNSSVSEV